MSIDVVTDFIDKTPNDPASFWDYTAITSLAGMKIPDVLYGDQQALLVADQYRLWLSWFVEGLLSPRAVAPDKTFRRLHVFQAVSQRVNKLYGGVDASRRERLTNKIADYIYAEIERLRDDVARDYADAATKLSLMAATTPPRCYICGFAFSQEAQDAFLKTPGRNPIELPLIVDVFRPRGLVERDVKIEIDHLVPVAKGGKGQPNLRLSCGWCNKYKSKRVSLYEASLMPPHTLPFRVSGHRLHELPNPFWTIRILALRPSCQHPGTCTKTAKDSELFIGLNDWSGSPNPTNLAVYCADHDPIASDRMQARAEVAKLWKDRKG